MKHITVFKNVRSLAVLFTVAVMVLGAALPVVAESLPGEGVTVRPGRPTWSTDYILEAIYSRALEDLGYEVEDPKTVSNPIFYQSLMNGDMDYWASGWFPIHNEQLPKNFEEKGSICGTIIDRKAVQGYLVSKKDAEKYNIKTIEDFKRPEVMEAFDDNGDGKADLVACPPGWGCEKMISYHMEVYNLEEYVNTIEAGYSASMADALARYNSGEPVFFYTWTPNWTVNRFKPGEDVVWIGVPELIPAPSQEGMEDAMIQEGLKGAVASPLKMGWIASSIQVVANNEFLENNPAAAKIFEVMSIPIEDVSAQNELMYSGEDSKEDIERHATQWIEKNREKWEKWQAQARQAAK